jgi:hypothetical protein
MKLKEKIRKELISESDNKERVKNLLKRIPKELLLDYLKDTGGDPDNSWARSFLKYLGIEVTAVTIGFWTELLRLNQDFDFDNGTADDIIVPELKEYSVTWIVKEIEILLNTYKVEKLAFSKEHIRDMIEDYEFDFTDGDVVGTTYIDGDIQSSRLSDIEEIEDI